MHLSKQIESMYDDAVRIRQDLHRIPEIGFQLRDTQAYVLRELRQCSPDRIETLAVCGVKAVFFAKDAETTIAFRADMDGIHNDEANDVPYCSRRRMTRSSNMRNSSCSLSVKKPFSFSCSSHATSSSWE